jgi:arginine/ornithine transport system permease protein
MEFEVIIKMLPLYFQGLWVTIYLVLLSLAIGLGMAIPIALLATSKKIWIRALPKAYIYFFRGTPLLVQMYMIYHGMAAGYTAEILRGTIEQTAYGEIEAARACGMSTAMVYRRIILPSTFRRALPAYGNEVIFMLHGSSLAGIITIMDLFGAARIVNARYYAPFEAYITAGLFYLVLTFLIVWGFKKAEHYWHAHLRARES